MADRLPVETMFDDYLARWKLAPDGDPMVTRTGAILPVRSAGLPAMLKIATVDEEKTGARLMSWWDGGGAAPVLRHGENALLLARACGGRSLAAMVQAGNDDESSRIICGVVAKLHAKRSRPAPQLPSLERWFGPLRPAADTHGGVLRLSATVAAALLESTEDAAVLHGDIHHGNVLDFGPAGRLAIDPKGLVGERGFDYANLFCNPDAAIALAPGRLRRQVAVVSRSAGLSPSRLLDWIVAWTGLSAVFLMQDGDPPDDVLELVERAAAERQR
jgi:streptomycin 6-kinase